MGSVNKSNDSSVRKFLGIHVRVFWCLALICALEVRCRLPYLNRQPRRSPFAPLTPRPRSTQVLLWSFCLFWSQSSGAAQAYYTRETVRARASSSAASIKCWPGNPPAESARIFTRRTPRSPRSPRRPQVNLKSTTGETVRVPTPPVDYRSLELALKVRRRPAAISRAARSRVSNDRSLRGAAWEMSNTPFFFRRLFFRASVAFARARRRRRRSSLASDTRSSALLFVCLRRHRLGKNTGGIRLAAARARVLLRDCSASRRGVRRAVGDFAFGSIR